MITTTATQEAILAAYLELSTKPQDWVRLARIRDLVTVDRDTVDAELLGLIRTGTVHLAPSSDRKNLTAEDYAAAIRVGTQDKHLLAVEEDFWA